MKRGKITIDSEMCKGCYLCIHSCPTNVISISKNANSSGTYAAIYSPSNNNTCIACGSCFQVCPDMAIEVYEAEGDENE